MRGAKAYSEINRLIILVNTLFLLSPITGSAYADDRCSKTAKIVEAIHNQVDEAIARGLATDTDRDLSKVVKAGQSDPGNLTLACVLLEQRQSNAERAKRKGNPWTPFPEKEIKSDQELFDACYLVPECRSETEIQRLLKAACPSEKKESGEERMAIAPEACAELAQSLAVTTRRKLSPVRTGVGLGLIIGGGAVVLLGALHMSFPLFSKADGCVVYGLAHPCSADRWGTGGGLLGGGLLTVGGGILTLVLP